MENGVPDSCNDAYESLLLPSLECSCSQTNPSPRSEAEEERSIYWTVQVTSAPQRLSENEGELVQEELQNI